MERTATRTVGTNRSRRQRIVSAYLLTHFLCIGALAPAGAVFAQGCADGSCTPTSGTATPPLSLGAFPGGAGGTPGGGLFSGGLLGQLFGRGGNNMLFLLFFMMLMQMLQGMGSGGSTPQQGPAEERPPLPPQDPRTSFRSGGPRDSLPTTPTPPSFLANPSLVIAEGKVYPSSMNLRSGSSITVFNTDPTAQTVNIKKRDGGITTQEIAAGGSHEFLFKNTGTYDLCVGGATPAPSPTPAGTATACATVTVTN